MPAAHCVSTVDGVILKADRGFLELVGRSEGEVIGISYRQLTDARDLKRSAEILAALEQGAAPVRLRKRYLRPDGSSVAANLLVTRFSDPDRLISTLFWRGNGRTLPPAKLWEAALRMRQIYAARIRLFGKDLSTDPIGSILIGIYLAEAEGRNVGLQEISSYAGIALSTAARWVRFLQQRGVIVATLDSALDLQLTKSGLENIEAMLATVYEAPDAAAMLA